MNEIADVVPLLFLAASLAVAGLASYFDWRERRIPNKVLAWALVYGVAIFAWGAAAEGYEAVSGAMRFSLLGTLIGMIVLLPAYLLRQVGAGDVKLMMVFGFLMGPFGAAFALLTGAVIGGIWALWLSWKSAGLEKVASNIKMMARSLYLTGLRRAEWDLRSAGAVRMPYGVALSAGAALVALLQLSLR